MNITYFSPINWNYLKQRPQHIAEQLSKQNVVYYIEPSMSFVNSLIKRGNSYQSRSFQVHPRLKVLRPGGLRLPKIVDLFGVSRLNRLNELRYLNQLFNISDIVWLGSPIYFGLIEDLFDKVIIYDKMDDYEQLTNNFLMKRLIRKSEIRLITKANLIFTSSQKLYDKVKGINKDTVLIRNGIDNSICKFESTNNDNKVARKIREIKKAGNLIFGYIGTVDHWFDYGAIKQIVAQSERNSMVIVGNNKMPRFNHPNVRYFEAVPKEQLGLIIKEFDFCLYPFKRNDFLDTIDPVKIYEYLSLNKKVIAVRSTETERFEGQIYLYTEIQGLRNILEQLTNIKKPFKSSRDLEHFINNNSWAQRVSEMLQYIGVNSLHELQ